VDAAVIPIQPSAGILDRLERLTPVQLAALLALLALCVRAIGLGDRPFWLDEAYSAWFSARGWQYLWTVVPTYEPHPPFYYSVLKLWRGVAGGSPAELRSLSVLFGVATIPVIIAAALEQERLQPTGRPLLAAAIAAFLAACSPMLIILGQEARPYPMLVFAYAVATLGLLRLMREFGDGLPGTWRSWLLLGIGTELALWAHGLGVLYAGCLALALLPAWAAAPIDRGRILRGIMAAAAVVLAYIPCLLLLAARTGDWGTGWLAWKPAMLLNLVGLYSVPGEAITVGSAVGAIALLFLVKRALQSVFETPGWSPCRAMLVLWLGPPAIAALVSATIFPIFLPRTLAATLIPAYLAVGAALARTDSRQERFILSAALVITLVPTAVQVALREPVEPWGAVRSYLAARVAPGDEVWVYPSDSALPLKAVGGVPVRMRSIPADYPAVGFKGPVRAGSPAVVSLTHEQAEALARRPDVAHVRTIWLVSRHPLLFDPKLDLPHALARVRQPGPMQQWAYIAVQPYRARQR
jgi:mannosyltransferase